MNIDFTASDNFGAIFVSVIVLCFAIAILKSIVKIVPQSEEWTVLRLGKFEKILTSGIHVIVPFIERVDRKISTKETVVEVSDLTAFSKDNASVKVSANIFFKIVDAKKACYDVQDLQKTLETIVSTNLRTLVGSLTVEDLMSKRDTINQGVLTIVNEASEQWGVKVLRVELQNMELPQKLTEAMHRQMEADREKRQAIIEAEGERQSTIEKAEGQKQEAILKAQAEKERVVLEAEAEKQQLILKAEAERQQAFLQAEAKERLAQAEAKSVEMISAAIKQGELSALNYDIAQKYTAALQAIGASENAKVVLLPNEFSKLSGSIAGISEIFQEMKK